MFDYFTCFSCASLAKNNISANLEIQNIEIRNLDQSQNVKITLDVLINLNCTNFHYDDRLYIMRIKKYEEYKEMKENLNEFELNSQMK